MRYWYAILLCLWLVPSLQAESRGSLVQGAEVLVAIEAVRHASDDVHLRNATVRLERLAATGQTGAASALAQLIVDGRIERTLEQARSWARAAYEAGESDAAFLLARMNMEGLGGPRDLNRAATLAREAARAGLPAASLMLYDLLQEAGDTLSAMEYLENAASAGYPRAQQLLGMHYAAGEGVSRSAEMAYFWLALADAHGQDNIEPWLDKLAAELAPETRRSLLLATLDWSPL